jgi:chorismate mutase/prephenate dehydratase
VKEQLVAYLGPPGTFCEEAARKRFREGALLKPCMELGEIWDRVESGEADFGVVPVENTTGGSVIPSLDLLFERDLKVCGEVELRIRHNLIVKPDTRLVEIRLVVSHPQAIAQCKRFLDEQLPLATRRTVESTAKAVQMLAETEYAAAIGTESAADIYGMKVLVKDIQDNPRNFTRFFIIGTRDSPPSGSDRTSIVFSVAHLPGTLVSVLEELSKRRINLTKIESRPTRQTPWEYLFYVDFEGHRSEKICHQALESMRKKTFFLKVLGSYPKARP